jgi:glutamate-1-semialdehyde 2,1-aminomutase
VSARWGIEPRRVEAARQRESARFAREHPRCLAALARAGRWMPRGVPMSWMATSFGHDPVVVAEGSGAWFTCLDGVRFLDTNIGDKSTFCGLDPEPVVRAVGERAARGWQFLLPTEEASDVAEELSRRWGLPLWQFTLSATQANVEAVRLARHATGRDKLLTFVGNYAGHNEELLVSYAGGDVRPPWLGLPSDVERRVDLIQFNDVATLEAALAGGEHACVLGEPALTNVGVVVPDPGFHDALRHITRETGTLLVLDETHTLICGPGGLVARWNLEPDVVTVGKAIGGGVPLGAYGMSEELGSAFRSHTGPGGLTGELATGGTLFGNALSMAASRAALTEVLTDDAYERTAALGAQLADGLEATITRAGLPWKVQRLYARSGWSFGGRLARDAAQADADDWPELRDVMHLAMANRGVWDALASAGPAVSVAATVGDVDHYLSVFEEVVSDLASI